MKVNWTGWHTTTIHGTTILIGQWVGRRADDVFVYANARAIPGCGLAAEKRKARAVLDKIMREQS